MGALKKILTTSGAEPGRGPPKKIGVGVVAPQVASSGRARAASLRLPLRPSYACVSATVVFVVRLSAMPWLL